MEGKSPKSWDLKAGNHGEALKRALDTYYARRSTRARNITFKSDLAELSFERVWTLPTALGLQMLIVYVLPGAPGEVLTCAHVGSYVLAAVFVVAKAIAAGRPKAVARPKASVAGCATTSAPAIAATSGRPLPCAVAGASGSARAVPTRALWSSAAVSSGRACTAIAA